MMYVIYAQVSAETRVRSSDKYLASGERLQFIGVRSRDVNAHAMAERESERCEGVAAIYKIEGQAVVFVAAYARRHLIEIDAPQAKPSTVSVAEPQSAADARAQREAAAAAQQREIAASGHPATTGFEALDEASAQWSSSNFSAPEHLGGE